MLDEIVCIEIDLAGKLASGRINPYTAALFVWSNRRVSIPKGGLRREISLRSNPSSKFGLAGELSSGRVPHRFAQTFLYV